jgi:hypothetical protein
MKRWNAVVSSIAVACAVAAPVRTRRDTPAPRIVVASQSVSQEPRAVDTYDERLARVERRAPGFGGMFIDAHGRLVVYLIDPSTLPSARAAIEAVFGPGRIPATGMRAVRGQYTISQLKGWTEQARAALQMPDVTLVDLDDARNRVTIGVTNRSRSTVVRRMLASLRIPPEAVIIESSRPIRPVAPR